jgi:SAM-dependent methyltransferase
MDEKEESELLHPWLSYALIQWLRGFLQPSMKVFEYGSGASSLFLAPRVRELVAVEHDADWFFRLKEVFLKKNQEGAVESNSLDDSLLTVRHALGTCQIRLIPPQKGLPSDAVYQSIHKAELAGYHFEKYAGSIDGYQEGYFDLIIIDGRARNACLQHAWPKLKPGGYLLFDDFHREHYQRLISPDLLKAFTIIGPGPRSRAFHYTLLYQKIKGKK